MKKFLKQSKLLKNRISSKEKGRDKLKITIFFVVFIILMADTKAQIQSPQIYSNIIEQNEFIVRDEPSSNLTENTSFTETNSNQNNDYTHQKTEIENEENKEQSMRNEFVESDNSETNQTTNDEIEYETNEVKLNDFSETRNKYDNIIKNESKSGIKTIEGIIIIEKIIFSDNEDNSESEISIIPIFPQKLFLNFALGSLLFIFVFLFINQISKTVLDIRSKNEIKNDINENKKKIKTKIDYFINKKPDKKNEKEISSN